MVYLLYRCIRVLCDTMDKLNGSTDHCIRVLYMQNTDTVITNYIPANY